MMKDYKNMTQEELEKELAEIVKKNYENGVVLLNHDYNINLAKSIKFVYDIEDIDSIIAILRAMKYKPDLKQYCKGMTDKGPLIHPITEEYSWKEQTYDDFISREEFINRTGIFVTPQHFSCIVYGLEWEEAKEQGITAGEFIENYADKYCGNIMEVPLQGTFKYLISDDYLSCIGDYEDVYDPNIWEVINCLARSHEYEYKSKWEMIEKYKVSLTDAMQTLYKYEMLITEPAGMMAN